MNERIKELKHQASLWCDKNVPEQYSEETNSYGTAWEDKFAELIVRECIAQCNDGDSRYFIATHFGIPEPRGWLCPKCGIDRGKEACPSGHHAALTGHCPMVGVAQ
jgi:hypothetical protein